VVAPTILSLLQSESLDPAYSLLRILTCPHDFSFVRRQVVKTERCAFSEYHVFPGHGMKMVRKDGQPLIFGTAKAKRLYCQRLKPSKLMWTQVSTHDTALASSFLY